MTATNLIHAGAVVYAAHVLWGVTALIVATALLSAVGRHRSTLRHGLWLGALIGVLGLPVLVALVDGRGWRLASVHIALPSGFSDTSKSSPAGTAGFHSSANHAEPGAEQAVGPLATEHFTSGETAVAEDEHLSRNSRQPGWALGLAPPQAGVAWSLVFLVWSLGSLLLALRSVVGWWQLKRLVREAHVPPPGWRATVLQQVRETLSLSELPQILLSRRVRVPMVAGVRHPIVLLPSALATDMSPAESADTLIHECAHIQRRDQWVLLLQRVALLAFWPHPLLHYLNRELERAREELCDNHVLTSSRPSAYAATLLRLGQICLPASQWGATMTMIGRKTMVEQRIRRLVDKHRNPDVVLSQWRRLGLALSMALLTAVVSSTQIRLRATPSPTDQKAAPKSAHHVSSGTGVRTVSEPAGDVEQRVAELTQDWDQLQLFEDVETWAAEIQGLVQIGPPAVPALTARLEKTEADLPLRLLGFTLRAIGDPRAVPALIRSIPRTLRRPGSDCGVQLKPGELKEFMLEHHDAGPDERGYVTLNRPVREISAALHGITRTSNGEEELYHTFLEGDGHQRDLQRQVYDRIAHRWADWWQTNWDRFVADARLAEVALPPLSLSGELGPGQFPTGPNVKISGGQSNVGMSPVESRGASCFLDLDTGRQPAWPEGLAYSSSTVGQQAVWLWAAQEGIDLAAVTYRAPGGDKDYYCLKAVATQAWEVPNERWDTIAEEVKQNIPLELGRPVGELLIHYDSEQNRFVPNRRATFLFITHEGTPGILRLTTQVLPQGTPLAQPKLPAMNDPVTAFRKRYGLSLASSAATQTLGPEQEEEEAGLEPVGVKIEYRFFVREN